MYEVTGNPCNMNNLSSVSKIKVVVESRLDSRLFFYILDGVQLSSLLPQASFQAREFILKHGMSEFLPVDEQMDLLEKGEEHTSELQSLRQLECRLLLEKTKR